MKIAIVTGASRGLGKNMAMKLAQSGVDVILTYHSRKDEADGVVAEIERSGRKALALQLDVSNSKSFAAFASNVKQALKSKWDRDTFDFLVNNAGVALHVPVSEVSEEQFDQVMNVHLKGVLFLTQRLLPLIANGGRIVNISSGLTRFSIPGYGTYSAMKSGIETLTKYLAKELGPRQITVNVVAPGAIETDFGGGAVRDNKQLNQFLASQTALGRVGVPDDVGGVIAMLCSEESRWINAQRIEVSGGMFL